MKAFLEKSAILTHQATDPVVLRPRDVTLSPVPGQAVLHGGAAAVLEDEHALQKTRERTSTAEAARAIARSPKATGPLPLAFAFVVLCGDGV